MIELHMNQASVSVGQTPEGNYIVRVEDPQSGIVMLLPLDPMAAVHLGNALTGKGLVVPNGLGPLEQAQARLRPPMPPPPPEPDHEGRG